MSEDEAIKILNDYLCKTHTKFSSIGAIGIPDKEFFAIETLLGLYKQEKEKNSQIQKYVRSNEWAEDYEKSSCRTKILKILEE